MWRHGLVTAANMSNNQYRHQINRLSILVVTSGYCALNLYSWRGCTSEYHSSYCWWLSAVSGRYTCGTLVRTSVHPLVPLWPSLSNLSPLFSCNQHRRGSALILHAFRLFTRSDLTSFTHRFLLAVLHITFYFVSALNKWLRWSTF